MFKIQILPALRDTSVGKKKIQNNREGKEFLGRFSNRYQLKRKKSTNVNILSPSRLQELLPFTKNRSQKVLMQNQRR